MAKVIARTEFAAAVAALAKERGVDPEIVLETLESAIVAAFRKDAKEAGREIDEELEYKVSVDPSSGEIRIVSYDPENSDTEKDVTPPGFGRIAAQTAKQVIIQKIREAEKSAVIASYQDRIDNVMNGMVLRFDGSHIIVDLGKAEAVMPPQEQTPTDHYELNQRMAFYIEGIRETIRGKEIIVSRAHKQLVAKLFKREVPEVNAGSVEIRSIAREPGARTKIAVFSTQQGVDPVGSCVGQKGVRVQAVIDELKGEKIDIIEYSEDPSRFIAAAMSPATVEAVKIDADTHTALITVPDDQLSLAIGKDGQNVRLAAKLTEYKLDVIGSSGIKPESSKIVDPKVEPEAEEQTTFESLNSRIKTSLEAAGINSIEELEHQEDLTTIPGIGPKAAEEIQTLLEKVSE